MFAPFIYDCDLSVQVYTESKKFILEKKYWERIKELGWAYHSVGDLIPQTELSLWSGHIFPWIESWEDLQISFNLCLFGFYKQAMISLRSGLDLGLLSVYWNLNDDGHEVIQDWVRSREDTPYRNPVFRKIDQHRNFQLFQKRFDLKSMLKHLDFLHDYAHTKGGQFSNSLGLLKSNFQTFEEKGFITWLDAFAEVIKVLSIFHLVKYPLGTIEVDYFKKFGIDTPSFGGLDSHEIRNLEQIIGEEVFETIREIAMTDEHVRNILDWVSSLPDMTNGERENQIIEFDKGMIERQGLESWLKREKLILESLPQEEKEKYIRRIEMLTEWAKYNGLEKSAWERQQRR